MMAEISVLQLQKDLKPPSNPLSRSFHRKRIPEMPGVPIFHLHTRPPSPQPLALPLLADISALNDPGPVGSVAPLLPSLKKRKSILKKMGIPITWGDQPTTYHSQNHHNKMHKKNVHFTPPPSAHSDQATTATWTDHPQVVSIDSEIGLLTPETTPVSSEKKARKGVLSGMFGKNNKSNTHIVLPPTPPQSATPSTTHFDTDQNGDGGLDPWHHHATYFPEYEPINPPSNAVPGLPGVANHSTYFPDYTPVFHASHPVNAYPGASGALAYALSTPEAEAAAHAQRVGHSITIHYPDLPRFAEYQQQQQQQQGGKGVSGSTWQSGKWGIEGWTGFGWAGEKLPMEDGTTFGAPMPQGVPMLVEKEGGKNKKKKKKGGDGEDGEDGEDAEDDEKEDGAEGEEAQTVADGASGGAAGGGGGGGGKKKNKKKKK